MHFFCASFFPILWLPPRKANTLLLKGNSYEITKMGGEEEKEEEKVRKNATTKVFYFLHFLLRGYSPLPFSLNADIS